jgi:hypothetical protein
MIVQNNTIQLKWYHILSGAANKHVGEIGDAVNGDAECRDPVQSRLESPDIELRVKICDRTWKISLPF